MIYAQPLQAGPRAEVDALADELGEAINVLITGRLIGIDDRVRLVSAMLDLGERAGLRGSSGDA